MEEAQKEYGSREGYLLGEINSITVSKGNGGDNNMLIRDMKVWIDLIED